MVKRKYSTPIVRRTSRDSFLSEGNYAMQALEKHMLVLVTRIQDAIAECLDDLRCCREAGDRRAVRALSKELRRLRRALAWHTTEHAHSGEE